MIYKTKEKVITMKKNIYDCKHIKGVSTITLYKNGKPAGKIICNWSDNPAGTVCTAQVCLYDGEISNKIKEIHIKTEFLDCMVPATMIGKAGGYGYDKRSGAISAALRVGGIHDLLPVWAGAGDERKVFEAAGFEWFDII